MDMIDHNRWLDEIRQEQDRRRHDYDRPDYDPDGDVLRAIDSIERTLALPDWAFGHRAAQERARLIRDLALLKGERDRVR